MLSLFYKRSTKDRRTRRRQRRATFEALESRTMLAGDISLVRYFDTWNAGIIRSTDPAGLTYDPPTGHLILVDSEIDELSVFNGDNMFEISLKGDHVYRTIKSNNEEPTGITYNAYDGYYYVTKDTSGRELLRYNSALNQPLATLDLTDSPASVDDPEDVTSDPATGFLYVADGSGGGRQVAVFNSNLTFQYRFPVQGGDPAGLAFHPTLRHLFVSSPSDREIYEYTLTGTFVESYDYSGFSPKTRTTDGLAWAPTSDPNDNPAALSLYMIDRGRDNYPDGGVYEIRIGNAPPAGNTAPLVMAGGDQTIEVPNLSTPAVATLNATVTDDGLPTPPGAVSVQWAKVSGPANVTFANAQAIDTTVSLPAAGSYVLRLTASDGTLSASDEVTVSVMDGVPYKVNVRVSAGSDDAEQAASGGVSTTGSDLELIRDGTTAQTVGLRFNGVAVPSGATIVSAYVQFQTDEVKTESTLLTIHGQAADQAATFSATTGNITSRPRTAASASWSPPAWSMVGEAGAAQRTSNISAVIQEIVDRPGWASGHALALFVSGSGVRTAESYEGTSAGAPLLHVEFTVGGPAVNRAPLVMAGGDQTISVPNLSTPAVATLDATVTDDGLPTPPGAVSVQWTRVSGPADVTFGNAQAVDTTVSLPAAGTYVLRLTANDGEFSTSDELTVSVIDAGPAVNTAPLVMAGGDQTISVPNLSTPAVATLDATVTDDGLPTPPGAVSVQWTRVSGPADVTFGNAQAVDTTVSLPAAGTYVLRLTANDGEFSTSDELTVSVLDGVPLQVNVRVSASSDDAEESVDSGAVDTRSSDLELIRDKTIAQTVGMRFNGVAIPPGATIVSAYLQFQTDTARTESTLLTIHGQAADQAATFSATTGNISSRPRTAAAASWSPPAWTTEGEAGAAQRTPDIAAVIQEIVNRPGWTSGNSLAILISGSGVRVAESYNGVPAGAPLLHVEYTVGGPAAPLAARLAATSAPFAAPSAAGYGAAGVPGASANTAVTAAPTTPDRGAVRSVDSFFDALGRSEESRKPFVGILALNRESDPLPDFSGTTDELSEFPFVKPPL